MKSPSLSLWIFLKKIKYKINEFQRIPLILAYLIRLMCCKYTSVETSYSSPWINTCQGIVPSLSLINSDLICKGKCIYCMVFSFLTGGLHIDLFKRNWIQYWFSTGGGRPGTAQPKAHLGLHSIMVHMVSCVLAH